jgi:N utilization substance protein B
VISDESDRFNPRDPKPADAGKPSKSAKRREARQLATQALYQWHMAKQSLNEIEAQFRVDNDFTDVDALLPRDPARGPGSSRPKSTSRWHPAWT